MSDVLISVLNATAEQRRKFLSKLRSQRYRDKMKAKRLQEFVGANFSVDKISAEDRKKLQSKIRSQRYRAKKKDKMVRCRAEYMRAYREKKREEKLKSQTAEPKKIIARNSTQRSRDFRARAAASRFLQTSTNTLSNLDDNDGVSFGKYKFEDTEDVFKESTFEAYIAAVDKIKFSIDPLTGEVKEEEINEEIKNNIGGCIETEDESEHFNINKKFAIDHIKQELKDVESTSHENTFDTYISRVINIDPSSFPVKEEASAKFWIKREDESENFSVYNSTIDNIKQEFEDPEESISDENTFKTYISRTANIDPRGHPIKEEINAEVWIKTEDELMDFEKNNTDNT